MLKKLQAQDAKLKGAAERGRYAQLVDLAGGAEGGSGSSPECCLLEVLDPEGRGGSSGGGSSAPPESVLQLVRYQLELRARGAAVTLDPTSKPAGGCSTHMWL